MRCYFHEELNAVATCQVCGKSLCKECAAKYTPCACDECVAMAEMHEVEMSKNRKAEALIDTNKEFLTAILKGIICSAILGTFYTQVVAAGDYDGFSQTMPFYIFFFFVPFGWALITYIEQWLPAFFMSGPAFIIYMLMKIGLSVYLGVFCFAFQVLLYIFKLIRAKTIK